MQYVGISMAWTAIGVVVAVIFDPLSFMIPLGAGTLLSTAAVVRACRGRPKRAFFVTGVTVSTLFFFAAHASLFAQCEQDSSSLAEWGFGGIVIFLVPIGVLVGGVLGLISAACCGVLKPNNRPEPQPF